MSMVTLEVRDVSQELYDVLVAEAERGGQSLQRFLLGLLEEAAERARAAAEPERRGPTDDLVEVEMQTKVVIDAG